MESLESMIQHFVQENLTAVPPVPCVYEVGDTVTFTNDYGIEFTGIKVVGFAREIDPDWRPESFIYLDWDCYWFPVSATHIRTECKASAAD